jgi:ribosomal-protein-alanine N-acetyltransferase
VVDIEELTGLNRWGYDAYQREILTNPDSIMLVARNTGIDQNSRRILGFFAGWVVTDELHVNNVASHPDYRKLGIGQSLMEVGMDEGRLRGIKFVLLEVRASNEPAQTLYRKLGFRFVGRRPDYYRNPVEDAMLMRMDI